MNCPKCGYQTSTARARKKLGKKLILTDTYYTYCKHIDCDWEEEIKPKEEYYLINKYENK